MTDNEIIKALECCGRLKGQDCDTCPLTELQLSECTAKVATESLDLINRLQKENKEKDEMLKAQADTIFLYERVIKDKNATIERLKDKLFLALHTDTAKRNIEAEAVKRFAERVLKIVTLRGRQKAYFDNLVKEMTEQSVNYGSSKTDKEREYGI